MNKKIKHLVALLDDENSQVAGTAMVELLKHKDELKEVLAGLQESDHVLLRKRVHQLQAILAFRERRRDFARQLKNGKLRLIDGLVGIHMLWYDNDNPHQIEQLWLDLCNKAEQYSVSSIDRLAYFMRKCAFESIEDSDLGADNFCLGAVLEELCGADFMLCSIARELAAKSGLELKIVQLLNHFTLMDRDGRILSPRNHWQLSSKAKMASFKIWDDSMLIKLALSMLFLLAVSSDSFRYIKTIGDCMALLGDKEQLDFLPYPYNSSTNTGTDNSKL